MLRTFPLRHGAENILRFAGGESLAGAREVRFELRLVHGHLEGGGRRSRYATDQVYSDERLETLVARGGADLHFLIPADVPESKASVGVGGESYTWELTVAAEIPGLDYHDAYMLPVYGAAVPTSSPAPPRRA